MTAIDSPATQPGPLVAGDWTVVPDGGSLGFSTRAMGWLPVRGRFTGFSGEARVDTSGGVTGALTIPVETIRTGIKMRDKDQRGGQVFRGRPLPAH